MTEGPLETARETVLEEWTDYNGHMNLAFFVLVFDRATDGFHARVGLGEGYRRRTGFSTFAVESHTRYLAELVQGRRVVCTTQLLGFDEKRLHYFHRMFDADGGALAATTELMALHVDLAKRRAAAMPDGVQDRLAEMFLGHARLARPDPAGRAMRLAGGRRKQGLAGGGRRATSWP